MDVLGYHAGCDCLDGKSLYHKQTLCCDDYIFDCRCLDAFYLGDSEKLLYIKISRGGYTIDVYPQIGTDTTHG